ncbi:MAG TPA: helix-turn-helix transcriptional regulator [Gammaproteobacteria bacterium]
MKSRELMAQRNALGQLLKSVREEKGLLQREVAERLGAPQSFVSKYESGERRIDLPELRYIADVLDAPFKSLLDRYEQAIGNFGRRHGTGSGQQ